MRLHVKAPKQWWGSQLQPGQGQAIDCAFLAPSFLSHLSPCSSPKVISLESSVIQRWCKKTLFLYRYLTLKNQWYHGKPDLCWYNFPRFLFSFPLWFLRINFPLHYLWTSTRSLVPNCLSFNKLHTPAMPPDMAVPCLAWFHALLQSHQPPAPLFQTMVETPQRGLPSVLFLLVRACYSIKMRDPCLFPFNLYWPYVLLWSTECDKSPEW